jgi:hypothetical protein
MASHPSAAVEEDDDSTVIESRYLVLENDCKGSKKHTTLSIQAGVEVQGHQASPCGVWKFVQSRGKSGRAAPQSGWFPIEFLQLCSKDEINPKKSARLDPAEEEEEKKRFVIFTLNGEPVHCSETLTRNGQPFTPPQTFTKFSSSYFFNAARNAGTELELFEILTSMAYHHPSMAQYIQTNLVEHRKLWAELYTIWDKTRGVKYSMVAEHWFHSFLAMMGPNTVCLLGILDVVRKTVRHRQDITYDARELRLTTKALPELRAALKNLGFDDILTDVDLHVVDPNARKVLYQAMLESGEYKLIGDGSAVLTKEMADIAKYTHCNASRIKFVSLLSGRVTVCPELMATPVFSKHVNPLPGTSDSFVFLLRRLDGLGHGRLVLIVRGQIVAVVCDCKDLPQWGFYCKHIFHLCKEGKISFNTRLAVAEDFLDRRRNPPEQLTYARLAVSEQAITVTAPWSWGADNAEDIVVSGMVRLAVSDSSEDAGAAPESENQTHERTSGERRSLGNSCITQASSSRELSKVWDEKVSEFSAYVSQFALGMKVNQGKTGLLNAPPMSRKVSEISTNKSIKFKKQKPVKKTVN